MKRESFTTENMQGVFAVPPLARGNDARRTIDFERNDRIVRYITGGGIRRLIYGGNAFLYHLTLAEYEPLLEWLAGLSDDFWCIPSAGPSYGRAMDQAPLLRKHQFPCVMMLPCGDPRDADGLERGLREIADAIGAPLILYFKEEGNFGSDKEAGLDVAGRLVDSGVCCAIKYAVIRKDPKEDEYLQGLLRRVDRGKVISGIGERPAIVHLRDWGLPGFTTGSGCIAPSRSSELLEACIRADYESAEKIRARFIPLEDLRDAWGPAKVLHSATELAGIAATGPLPPFHSALGTEQMERLGPVAKALRNKTAQASQAGG